MDQLHTVRGWWDDKRKRKMAVCFEMSIIEPAPGLCLTHSKGEVRKSLALLLMCVGGREKDLCNKIQVLIT
jgi:hypothetical protein